MKSFTTAMTDPLDCCDCIVDECCGCVCHDMDPRREGPVTASEIAARWDAVGERMQRALEPILAPIIERAQMLLDGM